MVLKAETSLEFLISLEHLAHYEPLACLEPLVATSKSPFHLLFYHQMPFFFPLSYPKDNCIIPRRASRVLREGKKSVFEYLRRALATVPTSRAVPAALEPPLHQ